MTTREARYLISGKARRRRRLGVAPCLVVLVLVATLLVSSVLLDRGSAAGSGRDCTTGAISAVGPVDARGAGDTTPDERCLDP